MKHELVITAAGHKGTLERLQQEFSATKLWEAADRDAALKVAAPRVRALAHFGHTKVDGKLMDALPKLEIISNFGVGVDQIDLAAANSPRADNPATAEICAAYSRSTTVRSRRRSRSVRRACW